MADAANFMRFGTFPSRHVAVVNRRGIGALVSRSGTKGLMVGRERLQSMLRDDSRQELAQWLENPKTTLFVVSLPEDFVPLTVQT